MEKESRAVAAKNPLDWFFALKETIDTARWVWGRFITKESVRIAKKMFALLFIVNVLNVSIPIFFSVGIDAVAGKFSEHPIIHWIALWLKDNLTIPPTITLPHFGETETTMGFLFAIIATTSILLIKLLEKIAGKYRGSQREKLFGENRAKGNF